MLFNARALLIEKRDMKKEAVTENVPKMTKKLKGVKKEIDLDSERKIRNRTLKSRQTDTDDEE